MDFKLINIALITIIIYLIYQTGDLWLGVLSKFLTIFAPFFFAFVVAYTLYPILSFLQDRGIKKNIAILIILTTILSIITLIGYLIVPLLMNQITSLFSGIITFIKEVSTKYNLDLGAFQETLNTSFNEILSQLGEYISNSAIKLISISLNSISFILITFSVSIYILIDMDTIREELKKHLKKRSKRLFLYFTRLDHEMHNYLSGFLKITLITIFEYGITYACIGHPNAIVLGILAALGGLIPYFGGMIINVVAAITAFVISPKLFIRTVIAFLILSIVDGYIINPFVYGKTNKIHPLIVILAVFAGGALFGITGIITSLPLAIILLATYNYFKYDIKEVIDDIRKAK